MSPAINGPDGLPAANSRRRKRNTSSKKERKAAKKAREAQAKATRDADVASCASDTEALVDSGDYLDADNEGTPRFGAEEGQESNHHAADADAAAVGYQPDLRLSLPVRRPTTGFLGNEISSQLVDLPAECHPRPTDRPELQDAATQTDTEIKAFSATVQDAPPILESLTSLLEEIRLSGPIQARAREIIMKALSEMDGEKDRSPLEQPHDAFATLTGNVLTADSDPAVVGATVIAALETLSADAGGVKTTAWRGPPPAAAEGEESNAPTSMHEAVSNAKRVVAEYVAKCAAAYDEPAPVSTPTPTMPPVPSPEEPAAVAQQPSPRASTSPRAPAIPPAHPEAAESTPPVHPQAAVADHTAQEPSPHRSAPATTSSVPGTETIVGPEVEQIFMMEHEQLHPTCPNGRAEFAILMNELIRRRAQGEDFDEILTVLSQKALDVDSSHGPAPESARRGRSRRQLQGQHCPLPAGAEELQGIFQANAAQLAAMNPPTQTGGAQAGQGRQTMRTGGRRREAGGLVEPVQKPAEGAPQRKEKGARGPRWNGRDKK